MNRIINTSNLTKCNLKISAVLVIAAILLLSPGWCFAEEKAEPAKSVDTVQSASADAPMRQHYGRHYDRFMDGVGGGRGGPGSGMGRGPGKGMGMGRGAGLGPRGFDPKEFGGRGPEWRSYVREQFSAPERMERLRKDSPEVVKIIEASKVVREQIEVVVAEATEEQTKGTLDNAEFKRKLQPLIKEQCELELQRKYIELEIMEKKIKQIRETLDKRKTMQSRLVELKISRILEDPSSALVEKKSVENEEQTDR